MKKIEIGEIHDSKYGKFIVTKLFEQNGYRKYYKIKFYNTGGESIVEASRIRAGNVYDSFAPTVAGIGYLGNASRKDNEKLHDVWRSMIHRCYVPNYSAYKDYGAKGVYVDPRWHSFENFLADAVVLEGFDLELYKQGKLVLDKDIKSTDNKYYSVQTCCWITRSQNALQSNAYMMSSFNAISPDGVLYTGINVNEFARAHGLTPQRVHDVLNGKAKQTKGWKFNKNREE